MLRENFIYERDSAKPMKDYFEILQVPENAGKQDIRKAYRNMMDRFPASRYPEKNMEIREAYRVLSNPALKQACLDFHHMEFSSKQVYRIAQQAMGNGNYREAARILEKALKMEKCKTHLYFLLGIAYLNEGKPRKAAGVLKNVVEVYSHDPYALAFYSKALLEDRRYRKAIEYARRGYELDKDNFVLSYCLVEGYMNTGEYEKAEAILKETLMNPAYRERQFNICTKLVYALFCGEKYKESIYYMEKLPTIEGDEDDKANLIEMLLDMHDMYVEYGMYQEADRCAAVILKMLPDGGDMADVKRRVEKILKLKPEINRFDRDEFIPDVIKGMIINELFPEIAVEYSEERQIAYSVLSEYNVLIDCNNCLMAVRYMKNNYPNIYALKKDFFDGIQDVKERKKLINKSYAMLCKYQDVIAEMMDELDDVSDCEEDELDDESDDGMEDWDDIYDDADGDAGGSEAGGSGADGKDGDNGASGGDSCGEDGNGADR